MAEIMAPKLPTMMALLVMMPKASLGSYWASFSEAMMGEWVGNARIAVSGGALRSIEAAAAQLLRILGV